MSKENATGFKTKDWLKPISWDEMPFAIANTAKPVGIISINVWFVFVNVPNWEVITSTCTLNWYTPYDRVFDWMTNSDERYVGLAVKSIFCPESIWVNVHVYL